MTVKGFFLFSNTYILKSIILLAALLNLAFRIIDNIDEYRLLLIAVLLFEIPVLQRLTSEHMMLWLQMEKAKFNETVLLLHLIALQWFFFEFFGQR